MDMLGTAMIFGIVLTICMVLYAPIYQINQDMYGVRIRPRKKVVEQDTLKPKDSFIQLLMKQIGEQVIATFPGIADERTRMLLTHANYRSPAHLATFIGVKTSAVCSIEVLMPAP